MTTNQNVLAMIMAKIDSCLTEQMLRDYLGGGSGENDLEAIESHLAICPSCEETLVLLEEEGDTMVRQAALGLAYAHSEGIVHRDIVELSAALAVLRYQLQERFSVAWRSRRDPELAAAIEKRIAESQRTQWSNSFPKSDEPFLPRKQQRFAGIPKFPDPFVGQVSFDRNDEFRHTDPIVELLKLADALAILPKIRPQLERLQQETSAGYERVRSLMETSDLRQVNLDWETMTVNEVRWDKRVGSGERLSKEELPGSQDWFDAYVFVQAATLIRKLPWQQSENRDATD